MAIIRACSYSCGVKTPEAPSGYSKILVTFSQGGNKLIDLTENDVTLTSDTVEVKLTQAQTRLFKAGQAVMQIRCYKSTYNAPGSKLFAIEVWPALNDEVLS